LYVQPLCAINIYMHKVLGKNFINLDNLIDIEGLLALKPKISAFIAANNSFIQPLKYLNAFLLDRNLQGSIDLQQKFSKSSDTIIKNLIDNDNFGTYIMFEEENVVQGSFTLNPRYTWDFKNKHRKNACQNHHIDSLLNFFYEWLDRQDIFKEYGRVNFFITYKGSKTEIHRDGINFYTDKSSITQDQLPFVAESPEPEQFILINFSDRKKFFLYDQEFGQKCHLAGTCNWFDSSNFHGSEIAEQACYSLRIDGMFSDQFYSKIQKMAVGTGVEPVTTA
jgi:hypothetical protein